MSSADTDQTLEKNTEEDAFLKLKTVSHVEHEADGLELEAASRKT